MIFRECNLAGAYIIEQERVDDGRGFFARLFCRREFEAHGLETGLVQISHALTIEQGTLRGLHYQRPPCAETKIVSCVAGAVYDVILDLRPDSASFGQHVGAELSLANGAMMYVPKGFAHGYITLSSNTHLVYFMDAFYDRSCERGVRWNDPAFAIDWPAEPRVVSPKDAAHPDFDTRFHLGIDDDPWRK